MIANDLELQIVHSEISVLKKELVDVKHQYEEERRLNSKYALDISKLNDTIGEQKRRASMQSGEISRMSAALASLTAKVDHCEMDQMRLRADQLNALERQRVNYDTQILETKEQMKKIQTKRVIVSASDPTTPPLRNSAEEGTRKKSHSTRAPGTRRAGPPKRSKTSNDACACVLM
eukprot:g425.t1